MFCVLYPDVYFVVLDGKPNGGNGAALVIEGRLSGRQIAIIDVKGEQWVDVVANTGDRLIAETPAVTLQEGAT